MSASKLFDDTLDGKEVEGGSGDRYLMPTKGTIILPRSRPGFPHRVHYEPDQNVCTIDTETVAVPTENDDESISTDNQEKYKLSIISI